MPCNLSSCRVYVHVYHIRSVTCSYHSDVSAGGTRTRVRKKRIRDADGKVIGHGAVEKYESPNGEWL
mgnify:FL=1